MDWLSTQAVPHGDEQLDDLWVPSWRSNRRRAARSECLLGFHAVFGSRCVGLQCSTPNARLQMLGSGSQRRLARNVIPNARLAILSSHVAVPALGFGKCGVATTVRVRLGALCLLLRHGVWVREPLSVHVVCDRVVIVCRPRGHRSSHVCVSLSDL